MTELLAALGILIAIGSLWLSAIQGAQAACIGGVVVGLAIYLELRGVRLRATQRSKTPR